MGQRGHPTFQSCPACSQGAGPFSLDCRLPPRRGLDFGQGGSVWLRPIPGEGLSCELSVANTPGSWGKKGLVFEGGSGQHTTASTASSVTAA